MARKHRRKSTERNPIEEAASRTPSIVLDAFAPQAALVLTLDAWLLLEALGSPYIIGGTITMRDTVLFYLALADADGLFAARAGGSLDELVHTWAKGRTPQEVLALRPQLAAALAAALAPASGSGADDAKKKPSTATAGG